MAGSAAPTQARILLALQGGGAHGAFTWGVLDHLLEDGRIGFEAISGASAGAMNAVVLADGWLSGGRDGAREKLEHFWRSTSLDGGLSAPVRGVLDRYLGAMSFGGVSDFWLKLFSNSASPYDFNPLNINPLRSFLEREIDFERVRACKEMQLFVSATNVETGKVRIFPCSELTADHLMASACLPTVFQAVEIDGVPYWDGGYMGNPALFPLFYGTKSDDLLLVQINPVSRKGVPRTPREIQNRLNEITFNATLLREMRAIDFVTRLIDTGKLSRADYKRLLMHRIALSEHVEDVEASTKLEAKWDFLSSLKTAGRAAAKRWLKRHFKDVGVRSTLELRAEYG